MTCQEALRLLYEVVDKEASQIDVEKVREHLNHCRHCLERYEFEEMFRGFILEKGSSQIKTEQLKHRILTCIKQEEEKPKSFFEIYKRAIFISAAALVVFIAIALSSAQLYRHHVAIYPFEKRHMEESSRGEPASTGTADISEARSYLASSMHLALSEEKVGFELINAGRDQIVGKEYLHFHFRRGTSAISLFIGNPADVYLPGFERVSLPHSEYFRHVCAQCQVIYWKQGNTIFIAVSDDKMIELPALIDAVQPI
jgi:mycothiol system anti-sigma-R factor